MSMSGQRLYAETMHQWYRNIKNKKTRLRLAMLNQLKQENNLTDDQADAYIKTLANKGAIIWLFQGWKIVYLGLPVEIYAHILSFVTGCPDPKNVFLAAHKRISDRVISANGWFVGKANENAVRIYNTRIALYKGSDGREDKGKNVILENSSEEELISNEAVILEQTYRIDRAKIISALIGSKTFNSFTSFAEFKQSLTEQDGYLGWMYHHAKHTRGLFRFSHLRHGDSGKIRAEKLLVLVNNPIATDESIIATLKDILNKSSKDRHSLRNYLQKKIGADELYQLTNLSNPSLRGSKVLL